MKTSLHQLLTVVLDEVQNSLINKRPLSFEFKNGPLIRALKESLHFVVLYREQRNVEWEIENE